MGKVVLTLVPFGCFGYSVRTSFVGLCEFSFSIAIDGNVLLISWSREGSCWLEGGGGRALARGPIAEVDPLQIFSTNAEKQYIVKQPFNHSGITTPLHVLSNDTSILK